MFSAARLSDAEVEWASERVRFYIRKSFRVVMAIERALADLKALNT